jgi:N-acetylglucosaminyldiphosphoundecaprenol N-acetyl-beta-D-mannosaminyltransferase
VKNLTDQNQNMTLPDATTRRVIDILGVTVDDLTLEEAVCRIVAWVQAHRVAPHLPAHLVVTANPEYLMAARNDRAFMTQLNAADLVTPDGIGLIIAGKLLKRPFCQRVTGVALAERLFQLSADGSSGLRLFLLGAAPGVADEAATRLREQYPDIQIVGAFAGQAGPEGDAETVARVQQAAPDIVLVAYGMVKQDRWALRNKDKCGAAVIIGVGGVLDYKAGRVALAPARLRQLGLEWAYRLYKEPWRWRRQLALPRFVLAVLWFRLRQTLKIDD